MTEQSSTLIKRILEAVLLAADEPLSVASLKKVLQLREETRCDSKQIKQCLLEISKTYQSRGVQLVEVASGYRFQIAGELMPWLAVLFRDKPPKYSKAFLETLAIIAYQQPITRAEIEAIRGVAVSSSILAGLQDRGWVTVVGHRETPGRPALFATSKAFLDYFHLTALAELPALPKLEEAPEKLDATQLGFQLTNPENKAADHG